LIKVNGGYDNMGSEYKVVGIRGATSLTEDHPMKVTENVIELWNEIMNKNDISRIISVIFSVTPDIKSLNPATILREKLDLNNVPFMSLEEASFNDSRKKIIRVLIICESSTQNFVYLHEAKNLRTKKE
jgi:chorismate mutase